MKSVLSVLVCAGMAIGLVGRSVAAENVLLVPAVQEVTWSSDGPMELSGKSVAIVVGAKATEPEKYAGQRLSEQVAKRFGQQWPVVSENETPRADVLIVLGQRATHGVLDRLCRERNLNLSETSPGFDGYMIETFEADGRWVVLVGGSNPRGVTYGQDTLVQMIGQRGNQLVLERASVRDWPTVPWRGRPQTSVAHYLRPGELDLLVASRVNYIDLRNGTYAYEGGDKLEKELIGKVISEAHKRGMLVYGAVNTGVPISKRAAVMGTFEEMIGLGVDGLWLSFDDKGPGEAPEGMTHEVLELGRRHGMTGTKIAITPPKGSYQEVLTDFNRKIMNVAGMERALWFWTCLPNEANAGLARSIGLEIQPGWWHNWPRIEISPTFHPVPAMVMGWQGPDDEILATLEKTCETVVPWGGNQLPQYYVAPVIGWWGWNPADHDFADVRTRIYREVFGPGLVEKVRTFEDTLTELQAKLRYPLGKATTWQPVSPPQLWNLEDRAEALGLVGRLETMLAEIEKAAPEQTLLSGEQLAAEYLQKMRQEVVEDRAYGELPYVAYWWPEHQRQVLDALYDGDVAKADELIASVRERVLKEAQEVGDRLKGCRHAGGYAESWKKWADREAKDWQQLLAERQEEFKARIWEYGFYSAKIDDMLSKLNEPPMDWGTGRWERTNQERGVTLPAGREQFWGGWMGGRYEYKGMEVVAFAAERREPCNKGEYCELSGELTVSGRRDRLVLMIHLSNVNKAKVGGHEVAYRWAEHRFVQLLWGEKVLWEEDVGPDRPMGEWFVVKLPPLPAEVDKLPLRLRVEDRLWSMNNYTIVMVGPIRLVELAEP